MPRRIRLNLAGQPLHIVQRGNNRSACFFTAEDHQFQRNNGVSSNIQTIDLALVLTSFYGQTSPFRICRCSLS
ncbi:MAG: hypothetical protein LH481_00270, partial [Burkholderiales bacterium]|nr:hypothetical protein [Burkholderiales bacterium]